MKVKLTIEKTIFEERVIDMDEKFRRCACPMSEIDSVPMSLFAEAAREAAKLAGLPLYGDNTSEEEEAAGVIVWGECVENGEMIFEM